jgi:hypothetical protein
MDQPNLSDLIGQLLVEYEEDKKRIHVFNYKGSYRYWLDQFHAALQAAYDEINTLREELNK